jgi:hypothetical protein
VSGGGRVEKSNARSLLLDRGELGHSEMILAGSRVRGNRGQHPGGNEDDTERAVRAGLELVAAVDVLKTLSPLSTVWKNEAAFRENTKDKRHLDNVGRVSPAR